MSLVEKALEKMRGQAARPMRLAASEAVYGQVALTGATRAAHGTPERIVVIDQDALRAAGLLPPAKQARQIAEEYRQIKRPLIANALGRGATKLQNAHVIMMASAMPAEGKTFTSINLAFSMASEKDVTVLLVDADVAKPHISRLLGLDKERGLLDALQDPTLDVESLVLPTDVPGLSVLPAGKWSENATELLASQRMQQIVAGISRFDANRIALFDSPPLLLTTESRALSQVVGQIVMVVCANKSPQKVVLDAISQLGEHRCVSLVLNQSVANPTSNYYYYGYGYGQAREGAGNA
ncbi:MAG: AAA family ATPase [Steroidobacteraceae bacterium]|nr:AAA family ATPase [Steroidobacteraceae bacterium]